MSNKILDDMRDVMRRRHCSPKTLEAYRGWVRQLQGFTRNKDPKLLSSKDVKTVKSFLIETGCLEKNHNGERFCGIYSKKTT